MVKDIPRNIQCINSNFIENFSKTPRLREMLSPLNCRFKAQRLCASAGDIHSAQRVCTVDSSRQLGDAAFCIQHTNNPFSTDQYRPSPNVTYYVISRNPELHFSSLRPPVDATARRVSPLFGLQVHFICPLPELRTPHPAPSSFAPNWRGVSDTSRHFSVEITVAINCGNQVCPFAIPHRRPCQLFPAGVPAQLMPNY